VPEPDPGSASIFEYLGEGTTLFRGYDSEISFDCGNCSASLIVGLMPMQLTGIIVKCKACGSFNYTGDNPVGISEVSRMSNIGGDAKDWLKEKRLTHRSFRITDIPLIGEPILTGLTVEDSTVYGPAILAPLDGNSFDSIMFQTEAEGMLWEVTQGKRIIGVIGLRQCAFRRCTFDGIGIAGPSELIGKFREMVRPSAPIAPSNPPISH